MKIEVLSHEVDALKAKMTTLLRNHPNPIANSIPIDKIKAALVQANIETTYKADCKITSLTITPLPNVRICVKGVFDRYEHSQYKSAPQRNSFEIEVVHTFDS